MTGVSTVAASGLPLRVRAGPARPDGRTARASEASSSSQASRGPTGMTYSSRVRLEGNPLWRPVGGGVGRGGVLLGLAAVIDATPSATGTPTRTRSGAATERGSTGSAPEPGPPRLLRLCIASAGVQAAERARHTSMQVRARPRQPSPSVVAVAASQPSTPSKAHLGGGEPETVQRVTNPVKAASGHASADEAGGTTPRYQVLLPQPSPETPRYLPGPSLHVNTEATTSSTMPMELPVTPTLSSHVPVDPPRIRTKLSQALSPTSGATSSPLICSGRRGGLMCPTASSDAKQQEPHRPTASAQQSQLHPHRQVARRLFGRLEEDSPAVDALLHPSQIQPGSNTANMLPLQPEPSSVAGSKRIPSAATDAEAKPATHALHRKGLLSPTLTSALKRCSAPREHRGTRRWLKVGEVWRITGGAAAAGSVKGGVRWRLGKAPLARMRGEATRAHPRQEAGLKAEAALARVPPVSIPSLREHIRAVRVALVAQEAAGTSRAAGGEATAPALGAGGFTLHVGPKRPVQGDALMVPEHGPVNVAAPSAEISGGRGVQGGISLAIRGGGVAGNRAAARRRSPLHRSPSQTRQLALVAALAAATAFGLAAASSRNN